MPSSYEPISPDKLAKLEQLAQSLPPEQQGRLRELLQESLGRPLLISEESLLGVNTGGGSQWETTPEEVRMAPLAAMGGPAGLGATAARVGGQFLGNMAGNYLGEKAGYPNAGEFIGGMGTSYGISTVQNAAKHRAAVMAAKLSNDAKNKAADNWAAYLAKEKKIPKPVTPTSKGPGVPVGKGMPLEFKAPIDTPRIVMPHIPKLSLPPSKSPVDDIPELGKIGGVPVPQGGRPLGSLTPSEQNLADEMGKPIQDFLEDGTPVPSGMGLPESSPSFRTPRGVQLPPNLNSGSNPVKTIPMGGSATKEEVGGLITGSSPVKTMPTISFKPKGPEAKILKAAEKEAAKPIKQLKKVTEDVKKRNKHLVKSKGVTTSTPEGQGIDETNKAIDAYIITQNRYQ